jgi:hypothetical protein
MPFKGSILTLSLALATSSVTYACLPRPAKSIPGRGFSRRITLKTSPLGKGTCTTASFASADEGNGSLHIAAPSRVGGLELQYSGTLDTSGRFAIVVH